MHTEYLQKLTDRQVHDLYMKARRDEYARSQFRQRGSVFEATRRWQAAYAELKRRGLK